MMRKTLLIALVAGSIAGGGIAAVATQALAQGAPPPPPGMGAPGMGGPGMGGPGMGGPGMHPPMDGMRGPMGGPMGMHGGHMHGMMGRMRAFALIYPVRDRSLSGPDVQKIAEAFLLINGNHTWKITEVTEEPNRVTFALATADGQAIAHFAMDRHTARPERLS